MLAPVKGFLVEYSVALPPLALAFEFNPQSLTRTRQITLSTDNTPPTVDAYDFALPTETARVAQGVTVEPEAFDIEILLDATDRMNDGDPLARRLGIQPELDTLRSMVEPKAQGPGGAQILASLGQGGTRAFERDQHASVLLFVWGTHILPVFLTSVDVTESAHLPDLTPYRATVKLGLQVIESNNPFYAVEKIRQAASAALNTGHAAVTTLGGLF